MENNSEKNGEGSPQNTPVEAQQLPESPNTDSPKQNKSATDPPESPATDTHKKRNIKIGSQRDGAEETGVHGHHISYGTEVARPSQENTATGNSQAVTSNAPPTIDSVVTPELQQEIDLAISDSQIDQLLNSPAAIANDALAEGERVEGKVHSVSEEHVLIDLARPHQGILAIKQLESKPEIGTSLSVVVRRFDPVEGIYELAIPGAISDVENWHDLDENMVVEVSVTGHNKGGLEVTTHGLRGFIPASQIALFRVNNFEEFTGNKFACIVTKVEPERKNLILSRRAVLEREREANKEKLLSQLESGQIREGTVIRLQPFGAFVDLGGIDGLIHVSKMSWTRINDPSEVLTEGQSIKVKIERVNREAGKISLSYRDTFENPWDSVAERYPARSRVKGTVTRLTDFGAFIRLEAGIEGLLHVSEIAHRRVHRASDILQQDQQLEVQVLTVDPKAQRISLSLKALESPVDPEGAVEEGQTSRAKTNGGEKSVRTDLRGGTDRKSGGEQFGLKW